MPAVLLENRAFLSVSGEDASSFLQGILTTDIAAIPENEIWASALLTPQGKILFDFLIGRDAEGYVIETSANTIDALTKRLTMYRLRAKAVFTRRPEQTVSVCWGPEADGIADQGFLDKRFAIAGVTVRRIPGGSGADAPAAYAALRSSLGVIGGGEDGDLGEYFPHDLLMDKNSGLSFRKGCYIGQEVVSRMQHRSTARRRVATVTGQIGLGDVGQPVMAGSREVGALISVAGVSGVAVVRIDKVGAALAAEQQITVAGNPVGLALPGWTGLEWPSDADDAQS